MARKDDLGRAGEHAAEAYFRARGFEILDRNWRCRAGEIDLVVADADAIAIVEVKTRRSAAFGHPFEAIDARKLHRLHQLAREWRAAHRDIAGSRSIRVDGIAITGDPAAPPQIEHLRDLA
ncbi:YraN family protein [Microbacterium schleiferi]|uniref:UPF0102 protein IT882_09085 n=1 Tax=Microbacterium schleiferi TaxID=69362 RepID=A0A7S8RGM3_9MICO|nr:YraN family protein [Microbacterium schleiferi]QPE03512.1 YraN family protein [Microbacterium schleiferi]